MSFRRRIALVAAAAVAIAVVLASVLVYVLTSNQLHRQIDSQLRNRGHGVSALERVLLLQARARGARGASHGGVITLPDGVTIGAIGKPPATGAGKGAQTALPPGASDLFGRLPPAPGQVRGYQQIVDGNGRILARSAAGVTLPVDAATRRLAASGGTPVLRDAHVGGLHLRVLAEPLGQGRVVQFAQPLTEVDSLLGRLRLILILLDVGGIALAALLGRIVAGAAVAPIRHLTEAAEHVTVTRDLSRRIEPGSQDELGRLAGSFNAMLDALEQSMRALDSSVHAQRQLVADASHELRTPVTSLRTNIEILQQRGEDMSAPERERLLADVVEQTEDLTLLMNDLIELARGEEPRADSEELRLDVLVREVAERARRHGGGARLELELEPTLIACVPARIERAAANLLDNAVKHSPDGTAIEVVLKDGELTVRDHGPGISADDLPYVFDRFYRGAEARGRPGSGLGLAIVRQVAHQHGGSIAAEPAPGGGTLMRLRLPGAECVRDAREQDPATPEVTRAARA
jgi:two-component system, OmpR family, sensor histidine kinase MprB